MELSDKEFERFVKNAKKDGIELKTEEGYQQLYRDLYALAELTFDIWKFQKSLDRQLEESPEGFAFPADGRLCRLCMGGGAGDFWYDKRGMRCIDCQVAYSSGVIPGYVFTDDKNKRHITETSLIVRHGMDRKEIRKLMKEGTLKPRCIKRGVYPPTIVFLKRENPGLAVFG
ncbi:MAG TPA: hypothetical protein VJP80_01940 [Candidatus Saccharimonadales bacterium]|nr:hypothetical protein [Candidatus Saccharimonadales bacterium]